eukprot:Unigene5860_Nuclearia_a/m.17905 Unigene5860_Nuclearia_a/g.17905  ORF Unigene5860_Nuclearia_a/g.17905 Unigene5860_Nuclearia_a/m.17905 type:complete len:141 (-) Unigene5860_Nuclearia_a:31-453(-)
MEVALVALSARQAVDTTVTRSAPVPDRDALRKRTAAAAGVDDKSEPGSSESRSGDGDGDADAGDDAGDSGTAVVDELAVDVRERLAETAMFRWLVPALSLCLFVTVSLLIMVPIIVVVYEPRYGGVNDSSGSGSNYDAGV